MEIAALDYLTMQDWQAIAAACQQAGYHKTDFDFVIENMREAIGTMQAGLPETKVNVGLKVTHKKSGQSKTYPYLKRDQADGAGILAFSEDLKNRLF